MNTPVAPVEEETPSIKEVTLGQLFDILDYLKQFWLLIVSLAALVMFLVQYVAPNSAIKKLECEAENRAIKMENISSLALLEREKTGYLREQTRLRELQTMLLKIQLKNKESKLDLSMLDTEIEKLVTQALDNENRISDDIKDAKDNLKKAVSQVKSCRKGEV